MTSILGSRLHNHRLSTFGLPAQFLSLSVFLNNYSGTMAPPPVLPFRDINLHASPSHYAFLSPSSPDSPTLIVERPTGDLRLHSGALSGAKRISSIAGILGIIKLKLGEDRLSGMVGFVGFSPC